MSGSVFTGGAGNRNAGYASMTIDGEAFDLMSDGNYDATTVKREEQVGQSGPAGFSEMPKNGYIGGTLKDNGSLSVAAIMAKTASTVVLVLKNGKTVQGDNLWCAECSEVKTQEGTFSVKFVGTDVYELPV